MTQPQPNPDELVEMQHPKLPAAPPARTTRAAFDAMWAAKGFELVDVVSEAALPFAPGEEPWVATGARLEQELQKAGLAAEGTADDKRAALAAYHGQEA